jgi:hypothetical protein
MPKHRTAPWRHHHADELRQAGQQPAALVSTFCGWSGASTWRRQSPLLYRQHGVDEQPVPARRRNPPGRGMGADDQAHVLEVRHHVADGRRRQFQPAGATRCATPPADPSAM